MTDAYTDAVAQAASDHDTQIAEHDAALLERVQQAAAALHEGVAAVDTTAAPYEQIKPLLVNYEDEHLAAQQAYDLAVRPIKHAFRLAVEAAQDDRSS